MLAESPVGLRADGLGFLNSTWRSSLACRQGPEDLRTLGTSLSLHRCGPPGPCAALRCLLVKSQTSWSLGAVAATLLSFVFLIGPGHGQLGPEWFGFEWDTVTSDSEGESEGEGESESEEE